MRFKSSFWFYKEALMLTQSINLNEFYKVDQTSLSIQSLKTNHFFPSQIKIRKVN